MKSNIQNRARVLLPFHSDGYEAYLKEHYADDFIARRCRAPTNCEIRMASDQAKPLLANCSKVKVLSKFHNPVIVHRDGSTEPALECDQMRVNTKSNSCEQSNGFAFDPSDASGRRLIVLPKPAEATSPAIGDCKSPVANTARTPNGLAESSARTSVDKAQGLARITGQPPLVGWDGQMFGVKNAAGQTVFYKSVNNANTVYGPEVKRITLEMQEKARLETQAKADAAQWQNLPAHKKVAAILTEVFTSSKAGSDNKSPEQRQAKAVIANQHAKAMDMREELTSKAQQAKSKLEDVKSTIQQKASAVTSQLYDGAAAVKSRANAVKEQTLSNAKNTMTQANARATAQLTDVANAGRRFWQNANELLKRSPSQQQ